MNRRTNGLVRVRFDCVVSSFYLGAVQDSRIARKTLDDASKSSGMRLARDCYTDYVVVELDSSSQQTWRIQ